MGGLPLCCGQAVMITKEISVAFAQNHGVNSSTPCLLMAFARYIVLESQFIKRDTLSSAVSRGI